jgi:hypothetical protein
MTSKTQFLSYSLPYQVPFSHAEEKKVVSYEACRQSARFLR